jgi:cytochrome b subunit of formate dehydrogenase
MEEVVIMNDLEKRFIITTMLIISFLFVSITGIVMEFFELDRALEELIKDIHIISGFIMIFLVAIHFYFNWKLYKNEGKAFFR